MARTFEGKEKWLRILGYLFCISHCTSTIYRRTMDEKSQRDRVSLGAFT